MAYLRLFELAHATANRKPWWHGRVLLTSGLMLARAAARSDLFLSLGPDIIKLNFELLGDLEALAELRTSIRNTMTFVVVPNIQRHTINTRKSIRPGSSCYYAMWAKHLSSRARSRPYTRARYITWWLNRTRDLYWVEKPLSLTTHSILLFLYI